MPRSMNYPFLKGHGTENDFVLLPDPEGTLHGDLDPARVRALCDRRAGIGGDGVLRVIRTRHYDGPDAGDLPSPDEAEWFMDYRNSDGSIAEMCGNGIRVFARYLVDEGLAPADADIPVATRDGIKTVRVGDDRVSVDMGSPFVLGRTELAVGERRWPATNVDLGNPHAVALVADLDEAGDLRQPPAHDAAAYPHGVNVEFVVRRGERHIAMRVHERGSGETRSCGTGACAAVVAAALADELVAGVDGPPASDIVYRVDVPGGVLEVTWTADDRLLLSGPALLVARGTSSL